MTQYTLADLLDIMARLRDSEDGCPWDIEQDFSSIAPYTIEEAYEVADAIRRHDMADLNDELGDLLFQVVFHAQMAKEAGAFTFDDVIQAISEKMVRRHPHVFDDAEIADATAQTEAWESHKERERRQRSESGDQTDGDGQASLLDDVPLALPALIRAVKLQKRAARVGFDWPDIEPVLNKVREELDELEEALDNSPDNGDPANRKLEEEIGDLLFSIANMARKLHISPEKALTAANDKFTRRFQRIEALMAESGEALEMAGLDKLDRLWDRAKKEEAEEAEKGGSM